MSPQADTSGESGSEAEGRETIARGASTPVPEKISEEEQREIDRVLALSLHEAQTQEAAERALLEGAIAESLGSASPVSPASPAVVHASQPRVGEQPESGEGGQEQGGQDHDQPLAAAIAASLVSGIHDAALSPDEAAQLAQALDASRNTPEPTRAANPVDDERQLQQVLQASSLEDDDGGLTTALLESVNDTRRPRRLAAPVDTSGAGPSGSAGCDAPVLVSKARTRPAEQDKGKEQVRHGQQAKGVGQARNDDVRVVVCFSELGVATIRVVSSVAATPASISHTAVGHVCSDEDEFHTARAGNTPADAPATHGPGSESSGEDTSPPSPSCLRYRRRAANRRRRAEEQAAHDDADYALLSAAIYRAVVERTTLEEAAATHADVVQAARELPFLHVHDADTTDVTDRDSDGDELPGLRTDESDVDNVPSERARSFAPPRIPETLRRDHQAAAEFREELDRELAVHEQDGEDRGCGNAGLNMALLHRRNRDRAHNPQSWADEVSDEERSNGGAGSLGPLGCRAASFRGYGDIP